MLFIGEYKLSEDVDIKRVTTDRASAHSPTLHIAIPPPLQTLAVELMMTVCAIGAAPFLLFRSVVGTFLADGACWFIIHIDGMVMEGTQRNSHMGRSRDRDRNRGRYRNSGDCWSRVGVAVNCPV